MSFYGDVFGLFQTGYLYGKMHHIDIRQYGSGNSATTNALRVMGKKAGLLVYGRLPEDGFPACLVRLVMKGDPTWTCTSFMRAWGWSLATISPFYLHFKGGKGIASMAGHPRVHGLARDACLCSTVPWSCHHYKICLPWFYSGGDLILYPDTGLRGAWNIYRLCGSSHGVLCGCLRPDGDGDLETQDEHKDFYPGTENKLWGGKKKTE